MSRGVSLECLGVDFGAKAGLSIGQAAQDIPGRLPLPVDALDLASGERAKLGNATGRVKVQVRIEMLAMELIDGSACRLAMWVQPRCSRITEPLLDSTKALSPE